MAKKTQPQQSHQQQSPQQQAGTQNPFDAAAKQLAVAWTQKLTAANASLTSGMQPLLGLAQRFNDANAALADKLKKQDAAARGLAVGYGVLTVSLGGWVRAGLAGTTLGERLAFTHKQLSMQIASVFVPWIEKGVTALQHLTERFRALTGEQQQQIARWTALGVSLMGSLVIVPRLTAALKGLGGSLGLSIAANPLTAITAGIVGLLSMTDKGRESLSVLGKALMEAFEPLANIISQILVPALEGLSELLSTAAGRWVAFGTLFAIASVKVITVIRAMSMAFLSLRGVIGLGLGALLLGIGTLASGGRGAVNKQIDDIVAQVHAGKKSMKEAMDEVAELAGEEARKTRDRIEGVRFDVTGGGPEGFGESIMGQFKKLFPGNLNPEDEAERTRQDVLNRGKAALERAGKGRSDLTLAKTGTEDARATIRRLEDSVLKVDSGKETAKNTGDMAKTVEEIKKMMEKLGNLFGKKDNRPDAGKDD